MVAIDIGIRYIAVWLRLGCVPIFYKTFECPLPVANALKKRREKRGQRRCRKNRKHRDYLLRQFCQHYGLPVLPLGNNSYDPFRLRLDAVTDGKGLASLEELVVCIQHLIRLRGFDYHLMGDEGSTYPWGDDLNYQKAKTWAESGACPESYAEQLQIDVETLADWKSKPNKDGVIINKKEVFFKLLNEAVNRCKTDYLREHVLTPNLEAPKAHARPKARDQKIPRELVKAHLADIWERFWKTRAFPGGDDKKGEALIRLIGKKNRAYDQIDEFSIIDYHRKTRKEREQHTAKKTKNCPYYTWLFPDKTKSEPCAKKWDTDVRRFSLLEFLIQREVIATSSQTVRLKANAKMVSYLLDFLNRDAACFDEQGKRRAITGKSGRREAIQRPVQKGGWFKWYENEKQFGVKLKGTTNYPAKYQRKKEELDGFGKKEDMDANGKARLEKIKKELSALADKVTRTTYSQQNECYFKQLEDLLQPELSKLNARASLSAASAKKLYDIATVGTDFSPEVVLERLKRKENFPSQLHDYFNFKRDPERATGIYPQVEFLLGRRKVDKTTGRLTAKVTVEGKLRQILKLPEVRQRIAAALRNANLPANLPEEIIPDYAVVEVVRHAPKTEKEIAEIITENRENRAEKQRLITNYRRFGLSDKSSDGDIKRARCHSQQELKDEQSVCPLCLSKLPADPLDAKLELDHIYPEEWGGISEIVNLVLVHGDCNRKKSCNTPFLAARAGLLPKSWSEISGHAAVFDGWSKAKVLLFTDETFNEHHKPDWKNFTRQSQLARQLVHEMRHWLGFTPEKIPDATKRNNEASAHIGTPGGSLTAVCRQAWESKLPEFMRGKKDRSNLRNHLYDAAVLSYILPGVGLNVCGGIFERKFDLNTRAWTGLNVRSEIAPVVADLARFEKEHQTECLVEVPRSAKSKKQRFDTSIYPPPFMSPEALAEKLLRRHRKWLERRNRKLEQRHHKPVLPPNKLVASARSKAFADFQRYFRDKDKVNVCYTEEQLPTSVLQAWFDGNHSKPLQLANGTALSYLLPVQYIREKVEDLAKGVLGQNNNYDLAAFVRYFRQAGIKPEELPDKQIEKWLDRFNAQAGKADAPEQSDSKAGESAEAIKPIRLKSGTPVLRIPAEALKTGKPHGQAIHRDGHSKTAREIGAKGVAGKGGGETNWRLELWEGTDAEGRKKTQRWVIPHPRMLALLHSRGIKWRDKYPGETITWRQKFCGNGQGLLPHSKLVMIQGKDGRKHPARFFKGQLVRIPVNYTKGKISARDEVNEQTRYYWYRVTEIETKQRVGFSLSEFSPLKEPSAKELQSGKRKPLSEEQKFLNAISTPSKMDEDTLRLILETTYGHDQPRHPAN